MIKYDNFYSKSKAEIIINGSNIDDEFESRKILINASYNDDNECALNGL